LHRGLYFAYIFNASSHASNWRNCPSHRRDFNRLTASMLRSASANAIMLLFFIPDSPSVLLNMARAVYRQALSLRRLYLLPALFSLR
jgi:hypothetical protein